MKFPDLPIPITGFKIEVDHWALGYYLFERLQEKFGLEQILDVNPRSENWKKGYRKRVSVCPLY
ncbi:hypothetical protein HYR99_16140 [Candidatus Poribacteria bacterium]|nr:hypothetical protein [Candidatus Poribacteria bacterium]